MRKIVADQMRSSARAFLEIVWPVIKDSIGGGEIVPVEDVTEDHFKTNLDQLAGIDAWHLQRDPGRMRGLASRVQWIKSDISPWNTFTVRYALNSGLATEYAKRTRSLTESESGWLYPALTTQAYIAVDTNEFISAATIRTPDLFTILLDYEASNGFMYGKSCSGEPYIQINHADGNEFLVVGWEYLVGLGANIKITQNHENRQMDLFR